MKPRICSFVLTSSALVGLAINGFAGKSALPDTSSLQVDTLSPGKTQHLTSSDQVPDGLAGSDWQSIRAAWDAGRHAFIPIEGGWQARNPGQRWTTKFDRRGFLSQPRDGAWSWGLELQSYGFGEEQQIVGGNTPAVKAEGQRLTYQWNSDVQEWFVNDQRGLEHGFIINQRPTTLPNSRSSTLTFLLNTRGNLRPKISDDTKGVLFQDATGATVINYTGLKVWDADGKILSSHFAPLDPRHSSVVTLRVDERGARYPITIDPIAQQAYLKPNETGSGAVNDSFGIAVAVSGDTVVVGAHREDSSTTGINSTPDEGVSGSGAAFVFVRNGTTWSQQAYLKPAVVGATQAGDNFGRSVAVSGDTVVVGAYQEDSSTTGINGTPDEGASGSGAAYVFVRSGTTWSQQAYLKPAAVGTTQTDDNFGWSVAVSGDTVVVGALGEDSNATGINSTPNEGASGSGAAYVFVRSGTTWSQQAYIKPAAVGTTQVNDNFGWSVAVSADTVVVGAYVEDSSTTGINSTPNEGAGGSGAAYVFVRSGTTWSQQAYLKPAAVGTTQAGDNFGYSVAVSGDTVVVGANAEDSSTTGINSTPNEGAGGSGAAYVFVRSGTTWSQQAYFKPAAVGTTQASDGFGFSVAVSGDTVVVGAVGEDSSTTGINSTPNEGASASGAACVFVRSGTTWSQEAYLKPSAVGTTQAGDNFGYSVTVSGDTVVVGAVEEASSAASINSTPNEGASGSGSAYVFVRGGTTWSQQAFVKPSETGSGAAGDQFGFSVAVSGDTVVVGAVAEDSSTTGINNTPDEGAADSGAAYVFVRNDTTWSQQAYLKPSAVGTTQVNDQFGWAVAVSGDTVVVGAFLEDSSSTGVNSTPDESAADSGAAYVFVRNGTTWSQQAYLKPAAVGTTQANDRFGSSVAVSGDTVVVGAYGDDSSTTGINGTPNEGASASGAAYVFVRSGTTWDQQAYLKPAAVGTTQLGDQFGWSLAVSGDTVVVGAYQEDSSTTGINSTPNEAASASGAAYVFVRSGTTWSQQAYLKPAGVGTTQAVDQFGWSVAVSGDTVVVGAVGEDSSTTGINSAPNEGATGSGAVYVFARNGATWSQQAYLKPAAVGTTQVNDQFGYSVAISDGTVVVGANAEDSSTTGINSTPDESAADSGAAYVFVCSGTTWNQETYLKPAVVGTTQANDQFGWSVAVSGNTVVGGAYLEDSSTTGINSTPNEGTVNSGAVYTFFINTAPTDIALSASSVAENQSIGTTVGNLSTTDPNSGDTHTFTLVAGVGDTDNGSFTIVGSTLQTAAVFDYETKNSYSIRLRATDEGGLFFEKQFTIAVVAVVPATISTPPQSQSAIVGSNVTFSVAAAGSEPLFYQWRHAGTNLLNQTNATLLITNVQAGDAGTYSVVVSNSLDSVTSEEALLTVVFPPEITAHPASVSGAAETDASFSVSATSSASIYYQWLKNGIAVANATNAVLSFTNLQPIHRGTYSVIVSNVAGATLSSNATMTVIVECIANRTITNALESELESAICGGGTVIVGNDLQIGLSETKVISQDTVLDASAHSLTISGEGSLRVFTVNPGVRFELRGVTVTSGKSTNGAAIYNNGGHVILTNCTFSYNVAQGTNGITAGSGGQSAYGGAVYNNGGTLAVSNSTFLENQAVGGNGAQGWNGGAGPNTGGTGGVGGSAAGGAIYHNGSNVVSIVNCTFFRNSVFGGAGGRGGNGGNGYTYTYSCGFSTCIGTVNGGRGGFGGNGGGAMGGSISVSGTNCTLVNITMSHGRAAGGSAGAGGSSGAYGPGSGSTGFSGGSYGGNIYGSFPWLVNSIVAGHLGGGNCYATFIDGGNNICSDSTAGFTNATSLNSTDPRLATDVGIHGGKTMTLALFSDSPAIDNANPTFSPARDQRGGQRIGIPDIGAFEYNAIFPIAPTNIVLNPSFVSENMPEGALVGILTAEPANANDEYVFTLVSGSGDSDNASFTISGTNLLTAALFDYETKNSFSIRVRATDAGGSFLEKQLTIAALAVNPLPPAIAWQKSFGGSSDDFCRAVEQTSDGGYVLAGESKSDISGNKTTPGHSFGDFWLLKLDESGNQLWEKSFGGTSFEYFGALQQTADQGYLLGGRSHSDVSGNKTSPHYGSGDFWVIKLDSSGDKTWENSFGGSDADELTCLQQTSDGGYILGGRSQSGVSGNKASANHGFIDYWVIKLDGNGSKVWEKSFGGSGADVLSSLQETSDGGYILGGHSTSGISGNKTSPNYSSYLNTADYWVIKLDGDGNKVWEKTFGGNDQDVLLSLQQTTDGGYILGGGSYSEISGNKTSPLYSTFFGGGDFWVLKLDGDGNKIWENSFGGDDQDWLQSLRQTSDGGYFLGGYSASPISGNKTSPLRGNSFNSEGDYWIIKLDGSGNKLYEKSYGGSSGDILVSVNETTGNGYVLAGYSESVPSGNKTSQSFGGSDYWIIKLEPNQQPTDISLIDNLIYEKHPAGTPVGTLAAVDANAGDSHTFTLAGGEGAADNASFSIDGNILRSSVMFDFAAKTNYSVRVRATDDGGLFFEEQFTITIEYVEPIVITASPSTLTAPPGGNATLDVAFTGSIPQFQWFKNGNALSGATNSSLSFPVIQTNHAARYHIVVSNVANSVTSSSAWLFVTGTDTNRPTSAITSPKAGERITNNFTFLLSGTAKDNAGGLGVAQIFYKLNGGPFQPASGTTNWSAPLQLTAGTNIVQVKAVDFGANESSVLNRTFFAVVFSPFTLATNGLGNISSTPNLLLGTPTNGAMLEVGRSYTIQAIPGADNVFSNWTGTATYTNAALTFIMQSNMNLTANFVPNPFIPAHGLYNGLFYETNELIGVRHQSGGFFTMKVKTNFAFSGKLLFDGDAVGVSGKFNVDGTFSKAFSRAKIGKDDLAVTLALDFANGTGQATGTISKGANWTAELTADRAIYGPTNNLPAAFVGNYTMLLPPGINAETEPGGYGYGLVTTTTNGLVILKGGLGDTHVMAQKVPLSMNKEWPLYATLYKDTRIYTNLLKTTNFALPVLATNKSYHRGSLLGWLTFTNGAPGVTNIAPAGTLSWIKTGGTNLPYAEGFTNQSVVTASKFIPPTLGNRMLAITNGTVTLTNGNLSVALTNGFTLNTNNAMLMATTNNRVKLSLSPKNGLLTGSFQHPDNTNKLTQFKGAVLYEQNYGGGVFLGTNQSGAVRVRGD